jgi:trehalose/maltose transport system permease protein
MNKSPVRVWAQRIGFSALVIIILIYILFPFYWSIRTSVVPQRAITERAQLIPSQLTGQNYRSLVCIDHDNPTARAIRSVFDCTVTNPAGEEVPVRFNDSFFNGLKNSAIVSTVSVLIALVIGSFAAYALGRIEFRGREVMLYAILAMTMFPQISILTGLFEFVRDIGAFGSISSMILTYPILTLPFTVWVLTSFFQGLPAEIEQAALVDGATAFQTFWRILLPLTAPALVTTGLLAFISAWNEYLFALAFTSINPAAQTVTVSIAKFSGAISQFEDPIREVMAAAIVVTIPLLILVLIFQRRITEGLTAGAVKG